MIKWVNRKTFTGIIIVLFILLIFCNFILSQLIKDDNKKALQPVSGNKTQNSKVTQGASVNPPSAATMSSLEVIRRTHVERGSDLTENVFYQGDKEIARQTIFKDGKVEQAGEIPDGKVKFYDDYNNTYGEEYYLNGKKNSITKTYYHDGRPQSVDRYRNGKLQTHKEYYASGTLRFETDYTDARNYKNNAEVGVGKLYYPDGTLKYEWHLTNSDRVGFKKSYNRDGTLRAETNYDEKGQVIKR